MIQSSTYEAEKTDPVHPLLNWVIDVKVPSDDKRDHIRFAIAQGGWIHRTNGAMLKSVRVEIEDGAYLPIKKQSTIILKHAKKVEDLRDKIPEFGKLYDMPSQHTKSVECEFGDNGWMKSLAEVIVGSQSMFNTVFFASLCCGFSGSIYYAGKEDALYFLGRKMDEDVDQKGVLMPMRF